MYKDTLQKVKRFMTETGMLQNCAEIILGVSGGPDSMTMLHILNELRDEFGYRLRVVHVNHGIRGKEALRDQQMVEKICSEWKIPCAVYNYDVPALALSWKMGTEEAGRKVRRIAFEKEKGNAVAIPEQVRVALAHNQNDMAETMLHHLARGTGIRGLCSLKPLNGEIIRPLLCLERNEIVNYVEENGIQTVLDSSNLEDDYTRNRIRRHILPLIERKKLINRLKRIEGQIRGIIGMLENDAYCNDILIQSAAVNAAVNSFNKELLANHIRTCVARDIREGKDETIDELVATLQKLMK